MARQCELVPKKSALQELCTYPERKRDCPDAAGRDVIDEFVGLQSELAVTKLYEESVDFREAISFYEQCGFSLCTFMPINPSHFPRMFEIDCLMVRKDLLQSD